MGITSRSILDNPSADDSEYANQDRQSEVKANARSSAGRPLATRWAHYSGGNASVYAIFAMFFQRLAPPWCGTHPQREGGILFRN